MKGAARRRPIIVNGDEPMKKTPFRLLIIIFSGMRLWSRPVSEKIN
jgi:hypothetical protein